MIRQLLLFCLLLGQPALLFGQWSLVSPSPDRPEVAAPREDLAAERARVLAHIEEATKDSLTRTHPR